MVLWFVLVSVPSLPFGTGEVGDVLHEELVRVIHQLLLFSLVLLDRVLY